MISCLDILLHQGMLLVHFFVFIVTQVPLSPNVKKGTTPRAL